MFVWEINDNATPSYLVPIDSNECHKSGKFKRMDDICSIDYVIKDLLAKNRLTENPVKLKKKMQVFLPQWLFCDIKPAKYYIYSLSP